MGELAISRAAAIDTGTADDGAASATGSVEHCRS